MSEQVEVGQIWRDCDKRVKPERFVLVLRIWKPLNGGLNYAIVRRCTADGGFHLRSRETRICVERMKPGATGYELVAQVAKKQSV